MCIDNIYTILRWPWTLVKAFVFQRLIWITFAMVWVLIFKVYAWIYKMQDCRMKHERHKDPGTAGG